MSFRFVVVAEQCSRTCVSTVALAICLYPANSRQRPVRLFPNLHAGETLAYQVSYRSDQQMATKSSMVVDSTAPPKQIDVRMLLRLRVLDVAPDGKRARIHARAWMEPASEGMEARHAPAKSVDFTMLPDGRVAAVKGLEDWTTEQRQAWQEWVARFTLTATLPGEEAKLSSRWKSLEPEKTPSPIRALTWFRESTYTGNEPCPSALLSVPSVAPEPSGEPAMCAVLLSTATLKQHSSEKNATPEDFRLHQLRTSGTARGKNQIITYVSLRTGLLVRATEEAGQTMDVTIAKADGTNRVHYKVTATSHSEVLLVSDPAPVRP